MLNAKHMAKLIKASLPVTFLMASILMVTFNAVAEVKLSTQKQDVENRKSPEPPY